MTTNKYFMVVFVPFPSLRFHYWLYVVTSVKNNTLFVNVQTNHDWYHFIVYSHTHLGAITDPHLIISVVLFINDVLEKISSIDILFLHKKIFIFLIIGEVSEM